MSSFQLTEQQLTFIQTFGYLHLPALLKDKIDRIDEAFEELMTSRGGKNHDGKQRFYVAPFFNHSEYLSSLLDDERIDSIATSLMGEDYQYWNSDGLYFAGDTDWHSDMPTWPERPLGHCSYKMAIYLDPLTAETGALRVVPGSHRCGEGFADALDGLFIKGENWNRRGGGGYYKATLGVDGSNIPAVALESQPGDVAIFDHAIKHSAWGGGARRRFTSINYFHRLSSDRLELFLQYLRYHGYTKSDVFGDPPGPLLTTAPPSRLRHLEQLLEYLPDVSNPQ